MQIPIGGDSTGQYVVITKKQAVRTAEALGPDGKTRVGRVVLDLSDKTAATQYQGCFLPLTVTGNVMGTSALAKGSELEVVPHVKVKTAKSGLPKKP